MTDRQQANAHMHTYWDARHYSMQLYVGYKMLDYLEVVRLNGCQPESFHKALQTASQHDCVHYSRLAAVMGLNTSVTSRWFVREKYTVPEIFRRRAAVQSIEKIIGYDLTRFQAGQPWIGGKSMKDDPHLGVSFDAPLVVPARPENLERFVENVPFMDGHK